MSSLASTVRSVASYTARCNVLIPRRRYVQVPREKLPPPLKLEDFRTEMRKTDLSRDQGKRIHTGDKPFKCDLPGCDATSPPKSPTTWKLDGHKRTHTGDKPYKRDHPGCDAAFSDNANLNKHKRSHTGEKPFKCDHPGCPETFSEKQKRTSSGRIAPRERSCRVASTRCSLTIPPTIDARSSHYQYFLD